MLMKKIYIAILSVLLGTCGVLNAQVLPQDSLALVDLYNTTNGPNWSNNTNWLAGPVSTWNGVVVTGNRVTVLQLRQRNLIGTIPTSIANLNALTYLNLSVNSLVGTIPTAIGGITTLEKLYLDRNQFSGAFPASLINLTNLQELFLSYNNLTGSIPVGINALSNLRWLWLDGNQLSGDVPPSLMSMSNLEILGINGNNLSGTFPSGFGGLSSLTTLFAHENQFTGLIPSDIGNATGLTELWLNNNNFTGAIPPGMGTLPNLQAVGLNNNALTGTIPDFSAASDSLNWVLLENNQLTGIAAVTPNGSLNYYNVEGNQLDFRDLLPVVGITNNFYYANQDSIDDPVDTVVRVGRNITMDVSDNAAGNTYQWSVNGVEIQGATSLNYAINNAQELNSGQYTCKIGNPALPDLALYRSKINATMSTKPRSTTLENYEMEQTYLEGSKKDKFRLCLSVNEPLPAGIIGLDVCLEFNEDLVHPKRKAFSESVWNGGNANYVKYISDHHHEGGPILKEYYSLYFGKDAPADAQFTGTGNIACFEYESKTDDDVSSGVTFCGVDEGYLTHVISYGDGPVAGTGPASVSPPSTPLDLEGTIKFWDGDVLAWDANNPNDYVPTDISMVNINCSSFAGATQPDKNGKFEINNSTEQGISFKRDVEGDYANTGSCTDVSDFIDDKDAKEAAEIAATKGKDRNVFEMIASDVNMDGLVRANDATLICRRFNGYICEFPQAWNYNSNGTPAGSAVSLDWAFFDGEVMDNDPAFSEDPAFPISSGSGYSRDFIPRMYNCIPRPNTTNSSYQVDYQAILLGDVDGNWEDEDGGVSASPVRPDDITIANNPSSEGLFMVNFSDDPITTTAEKFTYRIINSMGELLESGEFLTNESNELNLQKYNKGNYWVVIYNGDEVISKQLLFL